jgi:hypothetical protein
VSVTKSYNPEDCVFPLSFVSFISRRQEMYSVLGSLDVISDILKRFAVSIADRHLRAACVENMKYSTSQPYRPLRPVTGIHLLYYANIAIKDCENCSWKTFLWENSIKLEKSIK